MMTRFTSHLAGLIAGICCAPTSLAVHMVRSQGADHFDGALDAFSEALAKTSGEVQPDDLGEPYQTHPRKSSLMRRDPASIEEPATSRAVLQGTSLYAMGSNVAHGPPKAVSGSMQARVPNMSEFIESGYAQSTLTEEIANAARVHTDDVSTSFSEVFSGAGESGTSYGIVRIDYNIHIAPDKSAEEIENDISMADVALLADRVEQALDHDNTGVSNPDFEVLHLDSEILLETLSPTPDNATNSSSPTPSPTPTPTPTPTPSPVVVSADPDPTAAPNPNDTNANWTHNRTEVTGFVEFLAEHAGTFLDNGDSQTAVSCAIAKAANVSCEEMTCTFSMTAYTAPETELLQVVDPVGPGDRISLAAGASSQLAEKDCIRVGFHVAVPKSKLLKTGLQLQYCDPTTLSDDIYTYMDGQGLNGIHVTILRISVNGTTVVEATPTTTEAPLPVLRTNTTTRPPPPSPDNSTPTNASGNASGNATDAARLGNASGNTTGGNPSGNSTAAATTSITTAAATSTTTAAATTTSTTTAAATTSKTNTSGNATSGNTSGSSTSF